MTDETRLRLEDRSSGPLASTRDLGHQRAIVSYGYAPHMMRMQRRTLLVALTSPFTTPNIMTVTLGGVPQATSPLCLGVVEVYFSDVLPAFGRGSSKLFILRTTEKPALQRSAGLL